MLLQLRDFRGAANQRHLQRRGRNARPRVGFALRGLAPEDHAVLRPQVDHKRSPVAILKARLQVHALARLVDALVDCLARQRARVQVLGERQGARVAQPELARDHGRQPVDNQVGRHAAPGIIATTLGRIAGAENGDFRLCVPQKVAELVGLVGIAVAAVRLLEDNLPVPVVEKAMAGEVEYVARVLQAVFERAPCRPP